MRGLPSQWLGYLGIGLVMLGLTGAIVITLLAQDGPLRRAVRNYETSLDRELRFLFAKTTGTRVIRIQLGICAALIAVGILADYPTLFPAVPIVLAVPLIVLRSRRTKRVHRIEEQLDAWLMMLSNALKASPSLGEGIASSAKLTQAPLSEELDLAIKEMKLGTAVDQALMNIAARVRSRVVASALATLLVGRQTGGDLPRILEESAATLRELSRLEGVVRTKTAEGKAQTYVLAGLPFFFIGAINELDPDWLKPLTTTTLGYILVGVAAALWVSAILAAKKILAVDV